MCALFIGIFYQENPTTGGFGARTWPLVIACHTSAVPKRRSSSEAGIHVEVESFGERVVRSNTEAGAREALRRTGGGVAPDWEKHRLMTTGTGTNTGSCRWHQKGFEDMIHPLKGYVDSQGSIVGWVVWPDPKVQMVQVCTETDRCVTGSISTGLPTSKKENFRSITAVAHLPIHTSSPSSSKFHFLDPPTLTGCFLLFPGDHPETCPKPPVRLVPNPARGRICSKQPHQQVTGVHSACHR